LIKYFKGKIYTRKNSQYNFRNEQYATSSYPLGEMEPLFLSYPVDVEDIVCIIKVAKMLMKNVVVRSGGHQYCGLSSGNTDTVSICMDRFNRIQKNEDGLVEV
jgi:FAD/FMN-containing dehydrogenase